MAPSAANMTPAFVSVVFLTQAKHYFPPLRLLAPQSNIRSDLEHLFPCELVVGMNGRIWVKSASVQQTLIIANLLQSAETMTAQQRQQLFRKVQQGAF